MRKKKESYSLLTGMLAFESKHQRERERKSVSMRKYKGRPLRDNRAPFGHRCTNWWIGGLERRTFEPTVYCFFFCDFVALWSLPGNFHCTKRKWLYRVTQFCKIITSIFKQLLLAQMIMILLNFTAKFKTVFFQLFILYQCKKYVHSSDNKLENFCFL